MPRYWRQWIYAVVVSVWVAPGWARAASWSAMDWIDGWSETSTPSWQQQLGVNQVTINCSDLSIRTTPQSCVSWIQQNPVPGITTYVPFINPNASTLLSNASLFSSSTAGIPTIPEIDIDDFFYSWESWSDTMTNAPQFLNQFITNLKSVNPNLKFGITLYEDEIGSSYLSNSRMPAAVRARFDVIRLFLHYRSNGANFASYVAQVKTVFPNAKVVAGVYAYDRIDYWPCTPTSSAACSTSQELAYFQQALTIQVQQMQQGLVTGLDIYPGYFGDETALYGSGSNSDQLACNNVTRCVSNSVAMRDDILAARTSYSEISTPVSSTVPYITQQPTPTSLSVGQTQIFQITASGSAPLSYQWKRNGSAISGATLSSYHTPAVTLADNGSTYLCVVSNAYGSQTSDAVTLTVTGAPGENAPVITAQPTNASLIVGQTEIFRLTATGAAPLSYQWTRNGSTISGATDSSYHTPSATLADNLSRYVCTVRNAYGSIASQAVELTVSGVAQPKISEAAASPPAKVFPNPWRSDRHAGLPVTFQYVEPGANIKIFTVSGHIVKTLYPTADSMGWDLKNDSGDRVASGLYLYIVTHVQGGKDRGRLAIIN